MNITDISSQAGSCRLVQRIASSLGVYLKGGNGTQAAIIEFNP